MVLIDTGPLVAAAIRTDPDHARCVAFFQHAMPPLVVPQLVLTEAAYLVGRIVDATAEAEFLRSIADAPLSLHAVDLVDLRRMAELVDTYADLRLGVVDACVIATAERLGATTIATLDHRHFTVVRPAHIAHFTLLP